MIIDRQKVRTTFAAYVRSYDDTDEKIRLKIVHTMHVAEISQRIARSLSLSAEDIDLAWLIGMLHDIGRFEQLRRYDTFDDAASIDHAAFGVSLLFEEGLIRRFAADPAEDAVIREAIADHNRYRLPTGLDERSRLFADLIRDADKIDIFRVCAETPMEDIYNVTTQEIHESLVTPAVLQAFLEHHAVEHSLKKTAVDHLVGHASLVFELVYPESIRITAEQGYAMKMLQLKSKCPQTNATIQQIRQELETYLQSAHGTGR